MCLGMWKNSGHLVAVPSQELHNNGGGGDSQLVLNDDYMGCDKIDLVQQQ